MSDKTGQQAMLSTQGLGKPVRLIGEGIKTWSVGGKCQRGLGHGLFNHIMDLAK